MTADVIPLRHDAADDRFAVGWALRADAAAEQQARIAAALQAWHAAAEKQADLQEEDDPWTLFGE